MLQYSHDRTERMVSQLWNSGILLSCLIVLYAVVQFLIVSFQTRITIEPLLLSFANHLLTVVFVLFLMAVVGWMCQLLIVHGEAFQLSLDEADDRRRSGSESSRKDG